MQAAEFWQQLSQRLDEWGKKSKSLLLLGSKEECCHVIRRLKHQPRLELKYICTDVERGAWRQVAAGVDILCVCPEVRHRHKVEIINYCHEKGKQAMLIPNTYEIFCREAAIRQIDDIPVFQPPSLRLKLETRAMKRLMDIIVAFIGLVGAIPFMLGTAIAIKLTDPGPLIYSQVRTGRGGKEFRVYKFRTMKVDAEKNTGPMLAQENDPRITKTGKFLRMVRLDELPQILNVLRGDMSIVGPRPERPFFVEKYIKETPEYAYRHNVKPGITGLAQVSGKYNTTAYDKLMYDLLYIQKCSLWTDVKIIIRTVKVLLTKSATEGVKGMDKGIDWGKYEVGRKKL